MSVRDPPGDQRFNGPAIRRSASRRADTERFVGTRLPRGERG
jgi:hypothetical protein